MCTYIYIYIYIDRERERCYVLYVLYVLVIPRHHSCNGGWGVQGRGGKSGT